ncbi:peptidoglycan D,D-transpeptidase FtsI family protein [Isobaculum melis]|uniref:Cell division protein FtsI/penicillin-binding protein 2 n=1 Tax=Isobaculum melis TaxID=142588 RepID=A0A1H9RT85_9LACT|nr:penicillin-binding protein 2 [Isobaculum melis]SER75758.1 Cell division protein FtsI/penicillin-binding protein 2 [Isobaculum melis]
MKEPKKKKGKKAKKSHIPFRLNLLFFFVFVFFAILVMRLGVLQIVMGEEFELQVKRTDKTTITGSVPRGMIYDAQGKILVGNDAMQAITYTRGATVSGEDMIKISDSLSQFITMDLETVTERDYKDFWTAKNSDKITERLSDSEKTLDGSEAYEAQLAKVTDADLATLTDQEKTSAAIYKRMNGAYALTTTYIKNKDVTDTEIAEVSERLADLPGVGTATDWVRNYPEGDLLKSILGSVTSEKEGLPNDQLAGFLAKGYARNDRVGKSYLEKQYEQVLSGTKSESESETNANGEVIKTLEKYKGESGDNLVLTIDSNFQAKVDNLVIDYLKQAKSSGKYVLTDRLFVVAMNPQNGEILALSGKKINQETGEIEDYAIGTFTTAYGMGSAVKGATVLSGYMDGALNVGDTIVDEPLVFKGSAPKASFFNRNGRIAINDIDALERSSNVYMMKTVIKMGGGSYVPNGNLNIDLDVFSKLRNYFGEFGLGRKTGIDLPGEQIGVPGGSTEAGKALDFAIGQYDSYTPLQMAQYVSTIANGGYRIAPRVVKEVRGTNPDGSLGPVKTTFEPKILNKLNVTPEELNQVQQGFYNVAHRPLGTAYSSFVGADFDLAAKTGTDEAFYDGEIDSLKGSPVTNVTFVGYAPSDNPEIALSVVVPWANQTTLSGINNDLARAVFETYFQGKK